MLQRSLGIELILQLDSFRNSATKISKCRSSDLSKLCPSDASHIRQLLQFFHSLQAGLNLYTSCSPQELRLPPGLSSALARGELSQQQSDKYEAPASPPAPTAAMRLPKAHHGTDSIRQASKVTVLGGAGGIGQPLSLLMKLNPRVTELALYDIKGGPGQQQKLYFEEITADFEGRCRR